MKKLVAAAVVACSAFTAGCASDPRSVSAEYVSPMQYSDFSCHQLAEQMQWVASEARGMASAQSEDRRRDAVMWGVGLVLFWPALFGLAQGDHKEELAELKGEYDTLNRLAIQKNCDQLTAQIAADQAAAAQQAQLQAAEARDRPRCGVVQQPDGTSKIVPC